MNEKMAARQIARKIEKNLSDQYMKEADGKIADKVFNLRAYKNARSIFCFVGVDREIDTNPILLDAFSKRKSVAVPRCSKQGIMNAFVISSLEDLEIGHWGLLEPKSSCEYMPPNSIDMCIVPCLACDRKGNRLGRGGGYYDRYFQRCQAPEICLCREKLLFENIPVEEHDFLVKKIITEKNIYCLSNGYLC